VLNHFDSLRNEIRQFVTIMVDERDSTTLMPALKACEYSVRILFSPQATKSCISPSGSVTYRCSYFHIFAEHFVSTSRLLTACPSRNMVLSSLKRCCSYPRHRVQVLFIAKSVSYMWPIFVSYSWYHLL
jgi:hypothetical protein